MGRIAFVFSGQGDQYPGMGRELLFSAGARAVFQRCDSLRSGTLVQCLEGSEEELKETRNTQPCLFAMEMAAAAALEEAGIRPNVVAGFSLGEMSALTYGGAMDLDSGFRLVCKRGEVMQQAAQKQETSMAAVLKLSHQKVEDLCAEFQQMYPVNFNGAGKISVAGAAQEMADFCTAVKQAGGKAIPLKVKGAFHSPFMAQAARDFATVLEKEILNKPNLPVYSDVTALPYEGEIKELLAQQICSPVQWERIVNHMINEGVDTFVEIGPGKTLCNLIRRMAPSVKVYSVSGDWDAVQKEVPHAEG